VTGALTICELGIANFDDCMEALKKFKGKVEDAVNYLLSKQE
jgi:hypothetical protein